MDDILYQLFTGSYSADIKADDAMKKASRTFEHLEEQLEAKTDAQFFADHWNACVELSRLENLAWFRQGFHFAFALIWEGLRPA